MKSFEQFKTELILIDQSEYTCNATILLPLFKISNPLYIIIQTHTKGIQTIQLQLHIKTIKQPALPPKVNVQDDCYKSPNDREAASEDRYYFQSFDVFL